MLQKFFYEYYLNINDIICDFYEISFSVQKNIGKELLITND